MARIYQPLQHETRGDCPIARARVPEYLRRDDQADQAELGRIAYQAYCDATGGISLVSRAQLPAWDELRPDIQAAWQAAAAAVRRAP